jgi:hypothetical protein
MTRSRTDARTDSQDAAVLARTIVAGSHGAKLLVPGWQHTPVGYLEDDGQPVLVLSPRERPRIEGPACLAVAADGTEVHLGGRLRMLRRPDDHVAGLLHAHARCLRTATLRPGPVTLVSLDVEHVTVTTGANRQVVPVVAYAVAAPDMFQAHARALAAHHRSEHSDLLIAVAARRLGTPADGVAGVAVRSLTPTHLVLDAVTTSGAWVCEVALQPALTDPRQLCRRLCALAFA